MSRERLIARTFVQLADTLVDDFDAVDFLHTLAERTVELLEVEAAGIVLVDQRGGMQLLASSTDEARLLELYALQHDEGPCLDCVRSGRAAGAHDPDVLRASWPRFADRLFAHGFRSALALPLRLRRETIGALNLFRSQAGALRDTDQQLAQAFADVATVGLIQERAIAAGELLAEQLQTALTTRIAIEQAKGILAERTGSTPGAAFEQMRRHARATGARLSVVAAAIIDGTLVAVPPR